MLNIGNRRECFWDDYLINEKETTAQFRIHEPVRRELVLKMDAPWDGDGNDYFNFFYDDEANIYRMYYLAWKMLKGLPIVVCYAESKDGIHWETPELGICEFEGSTANNIIVDKTMAGAIDNFMVFRDDNPACPSEERYKGIMVYYENDRKSLYAMFSPDGIHFHAGCEITDEGYFDSLNVVFWDKEAGLYRGYIRDFHDKDNPAERGDLAKSVRDIRYIESRDFKTWTDPILLDFQGGEDIPLYTNNVMPYPRAPHIYVGTPSRYIERKEWNGSFDELCGKEKRLERMEHSRRYGLTITDCVFMCSRDGKAFTRYDEAFIRPRSENQRNWTYGDCYPARGFAITPPETKGADPELSLLMPEDSHWLGEHTELYRYTIRCDGFVSLHAGGKEEKILTKQFVYDGSELYVNFATSAYGYAYFTLIAEDGTRVESCETFGNSIDRRVAFPDGAVASLAGKPVTLEIRLRDGDLYSMQFR